MAVQKWDTRANWAALNPTLVAGEMGIESDTGYEKVGDGKQPWSKLHYFGSPGLWAEFASDSDQSTTANTPTAVQFPIVGGKSGVNIIDNTKLTVSYPGVYVFEVLLQLQNADTSIHDVFFWLRKNNQAAAGNLALTTSAASVIESHGGTPGANNLLLDHTLQLAANDYIEIMWAPSDAQVTLKAGAAITSPYARPTRPSAVCNVFQIAAA